LDSEENLKAVAEFLSELKSVIRVDILPVHEYGKAKYPEIGMEYKLRVDPISQVRQKEILELFKSYGLNAQLGG